MSRKRTTWVLDTETKGTGAEMIPLERLEERKRLRGDRERVRVIREAEAESAVEPADEHELPREPRRFKVVNVLSRQVLADDAGISDALRALRGVDRIVDVNVYVWERGTGDWRPLKPSERRALWSLRSADPVDHEASPA
jgi:hypothetical protein